MDGREKPYRDKYKEITNDSNYDSSYTLTSHPVFNSENFKHLIYFAVHSTPKNFRQIPSIFPTFNRINKKTGIK
jgi:hypothetical protein